MMFMPFCGEAMRVPSVEWRETSVAEEDVFGTPFMPVVMLKKSFQCVADI